MIVYISRTQLL